MDEAAAIRNKALDHAWAWFEFHAAQRMTMVRFYLIAAGGIAAGIGYLWTSNQYLLCAFLSTFGAVTSFCFMKLDKRVSDLVKLGEAALKSQQAEIAKVLTHNEFEICRRGDELQNASGNRRYPYPYTYGENFRLLFGLAILAFSVLAIVSAWKALPWSTIYMVCSALTGPR